MRLAPVFRRFAGSFFLVASALVPLHAAGDGAGARILLLGTEVGAALPGGAFVTLDRLPGAGGVAAALEGARLKAQPVSTLPDRRPAPPSAFDELFLAARVELAAGDGGPSLSLGGERFGAAEFGVRLGAVADALEARARRVGFVEFVDRDDSFPAAMPAIRAALEPLGFDMLVLMVEPSDAVECAAPQPLHVSIASGVADRVPFGNGDGATRVTEAEAYLDASLRRSVARGCGPAYSLILKAVEDADHILVAHPLALPPEMADRLEREVFEAMFLDGSDRHEPVARYLETCIFCPGEAALSARLEALSARARVLALEDEMWGEIQDDTSRDRLAIYVDHCRLCTHSDTALTRIEQLDAAAAVRKQEQRDFMAAKTARDLKGLRGYAETCVTCDHSDEARALIGELEADSAYQAERAALAEALEGQSPMTLQAYLDGCNTCDGAGEVRAVLDRLAALEAARAPCVAEAGLPQMGGPRKLEDIDQTAALAACGAATEAFPDDGLTQVLLGRIAQAKGDTGAAGTAYARGMDEGVPAAFGLAAYSAYAPAGGGPVDPERIETLALDGAARGDWLAHEILSVLYSKDLVPGKSGPEAFAAAMKIAREGDALAQFFVGHYYLTGVGGEQSEQKAAAWLRKAVDAGYTHANAFLADLHERPLGGQARPDLAAELYWTALQQGDATARDRLTTDLASRSAEVVRIIQGKLREQGLYMGAVDGVPGPGTEAAIRAFANSLTGQG